MSITIQRAHEMLNILEQIQEKPQLILTDLFKDNYGEAGFLQTLEINGRSTDAYFESQLHKLPTFQDISIKVQSSTLWIYVKALKTGQWAEFCMDDRIIYIDMKKKEYVLCTNTEDKYKSIIDKKYKLKAHEVSDFMKRYECYNTKKRFKTAFGSLCSNKRFFSKINSFLFNLFLPRKQAEAYFEQAKEDTDRKNEDSLYFYNEHIKYQSFIKEHISDHIENIHMIQKKVSEYLDSIGYIQNLNETDICF